MKPTSDVVWDAGYLDRTRRRCALGLSGAVVWFTGLPAAGKSTIAAAVEEALVVDRGRIAYRLDGDNMRHGLCADLGFSPADRAENVRRVGQVARVMADAGLIALVSLVSPQAAARDEARQACSEWTVPFLEAWIDTPLETCESRDPKGLYRRARAGELTGMTGIDDPYEAPSRPEVVLDGRDSLAVTVNTVLTALDAALAAAAGGTAGSAGP